MRKDIAEKWVTRLESGDYLQGKGWLRTGTEDPRYCCLGVLCEIAVEEKIIGPSWTDGAGSWAYEDESTVIPEEVQKWADMFDSDGTFLMQHSGQKEIPRLVELNDEKNFTFAEIAEVIRENYQRL